MLPKLPGLHPLAVGDSVLMRTSETLSAIDFNTGKRLWEAPLDRPANGQSLRQGGRVLQAVALQRCRGIAGFRCGTLSSDGHYVFSLEDAAKFNPKWEHVGCTAHTTNWRPTISTRKGKLTWHIGGDGPKGLAKEI